LRQRKVLERPAETVLVSTTAATANIVEVKSVSALCSTAVVEATKIAKDAMPEL
jgi:hypothetical protein